MCVLQKQFSSQLPLLATEPAKIIIKRFSFSSVHPKAELNTLLPPLRGGRIPGNRRLKAEMVLFALLLPSQM